MAKKTGKSKEVTIEQIVQALLDDTQVFPPRYLYKLSDLNLTDVPVLRQAWPKISIERRRSLVEDLNDFGESDDTLEFFDIGLIALEDPDAQVRLFGVRILDDYQDEEMLPKFFDMLVNDPSAEVRAETASALAPFVYLGEVEEIDPEDFRKVEDILIATHKGNDDLNVRRRALEALGFSSRPEVTELIQAAYDSDDSEWVISALYAMGRSYNEGWAPQVLAMLNDTRTAVRAEAVEAAGELELMDALEPVHGMLKDPDENVRYAAIWSLSQIAGEEVEGWLEELLDETEDEDEADLIEQALENLEFNRGLDLSMLELDESDDPSGFDEDNFLSSFSSNGRKN